ncbi:hypothetical protein [Citrobacter werkmanii]|uniref:hypothetical protein n=1 Tax=Citrobacter werkmanii TaxID=67827 RepID=UPI00254FE27C|nr:hypothetical protein [Citrobacter werkmanii]
MVINANEKLIKFPISEWMLKANGFTKELPSSTYCVCYQYDIDDNGFGPYGFSTIASDKLLSFLFSNILFFDKSKNKLDFCSNIDKRGVYFYGNKIGEIERQINEHSKLILKNKLKINKGLAEEVHAEKPLLFELYSDNKIEVDVVNEFISNKFDFLFNYFFTPMAGQTLILFNNEIWNKAVEYCKDNKIHTQEVCSIDDLKAW